MLDGLRIVATQRVTDVAGHLCTVKEECSDLKLVLIGLFRHETCKKLLLIDSLLKRNGIFKVFLWDFCIGQSVSFCPFSFEWTQCAFVNCFICFYCEEVDNMKPLPSIARSETSCVVVLGAHSSAL